MRSLALKLTLAFWALAIVGAIFLTVIVAGSVASEFDTFVQYDDRASSYAERNRNDSFPHGYPEPTDLRRFGGNTELPWERYESGTPERAFERGVGRAVFTGLCGTTIISLIIGFLLARLISRPLKELTVATEAVSAGNFSQQVPVRSKDEIGRLAASFNQMNADLDQSNQLRRQMTADIAHDLRTPLTVLSGYTEALQDGKLVGSPQIFSALDAQVNQLKHLVEDLRTLSLADAGELTLNRRLIDPKALLERTALSYFGVAEAQKITLKLKAADDLPAISVDTDRMGQLLGNLISNALRHTPTGGQIILSGKHAADRVILQIQDNGEGIDRQDLPHIFERFYRADEARHRTYGETGLGLAICRSIVEAHGGQITAESAGKGQGATFTISVPAALAA